MQEKNGIYYLEGKLDFGTAMEVWRDLSPKLRLQKNPWQLDLSAVKSLDSAALALLLSFVRLAKKNNHKIIFCHLPETLTKLASVSGVDALLA